MKRSAKFFTEDTGYISIYAIHTAFTGFPDISSKKYTSFCVCLRINDTDIMRYENARNSIDDADCIVARKCQRGLRHIIFYNVYKILSHSQRDRALRPLLV